MRIIYLCTLIIIIIGCNAKDVSSESQPSHEGLHRKSPDLQVSTYIWKEFKRRPATGIGDTLPFDSCFVEIQGDNFCYSRSGKLIYTDKLLQDTFYKYPVFSFLKHSDDKLHFVKGDSSEIVLKRFANEGEYEYFTRYQ